MTSDATVCFLRISTAAKNCWRAVFVGVTLSIWLWGVGCGAPPSTRTQLHQNALHTKTPLRLWLQHEEQGTIYIFDPRRGLLFFDVRPEKKTRLLARLPRFKGMYPGKMIFYQSMLYIVLQQSSSPSRSLFAAIDIRNPAAPRVVQQTVIEGQLATDTVHRHDKTLLFVSVSMTTATQSTQDMNKDERSIPTATVHSYDIRLPQQPRAQLPLTIRQLRFDLDRSTILYPPADQLGTPPTQETPSDYERQGFALSAARGHVLIAEKWGVSYRRRDALCVGVTQEVYTRLHVIPFSAGSLPQPPRQQFVLYGQPHLSGQQTVFFDKETGSYRYHGIYNVAKPLVLSRQIDRREIRLHTLQLGETRAPSFNSLDVQKEYPSGAYMVFHPSRPDAYYTDITSDRSAASAGEARYASTLHRLDLTSPAPLQRDQIDITAQQPQPRSLFSAEQGQLLLSFGRGDSSSCLVQAKPPVNPARVFIPSLLIARTEAEREPTVIGQHCLPHSTGRKTHSIDFPPTQQGQPWVVLENFQQGTVDSETQRYEHRLHLVRWSREKGRFKRTKLFSFPLLSQPTQLKPWRAAYLKTSQKAGQYTLLVFGENKLYLFGLDLSGKGAVTSSSSSFY